MVGGTTRRLILAFLLACASSTPAQILDLDRPLPPVLNEPTAIDLAIDTLTEESRNLARHVDVPVRERARIAVRDLAADLLRSSSDAARLWGLTIADRRDAIDAILLDADVPEAVAILLIADLDIPAFDLPSEPVELDRFIRDAFAELSVHTPVGSLPTGWIGTPDPAVTLDHFREILARWEREGVIDAQLAADLRSLTDAAENWAPYTASVLALQSIILDGARLLDQPALSEPATEEARARFARAVADTLTPELRARALDQLRESHDLAIMLEHAEALEARDARNAVIQSIEGALLPSEMAPAPSDLTLARTILALLAERTEMPAEDAIVRALRPAWRALSATARQTEIGLAGVLPLALNASSAMSNPGVLAPLGLHRASLDDLRIVLAVNELVQDPEATSREPVVRDDRRALAARLLRLGQSLADESDADRAARMLRELGEHAELLDRLEACAEQLGSLPAETAARVRDEIDTTRAAWIGAWSNDRDDELDQILPRLELLTELCERSAELSLLQDAPLAIHAWPAFELSPELMRIVSQQAADRLDQTALVLLEGDLTRARDRLGSYAQEHRVLILLARLERGLRSRGFARDSGLLDLVGGSPTSDAWLADLRNPLSELSLLLREIKGARARNEPRAERDIRLYANHLAKNLIGDVGDAR